MTDTAINISMTGAVEANLINACAARLKAKGVKIFFLFSCIDASAYKRNVGCLAVVQREYAKALTIPVLNSEAEVTYPDSLFYNTAFHLNKTGRALYTQKVIELLKHAGL